jgi:hypothetical protein
VLLAGIDFGEILLGMVALFFLFVFFWIFIAIFADIFRCPDISGWGNQRLGKGRLDAADRGVAVFGCLIYVIARPAIVVE